MYGMLSIVLLIACAHGQSNTLNRIASRTSSISRNSQYPISGLSCRMADGEIGECISHSYCNLPIKETDIRFSIQCPLDNMCCPAANKILPDTTLNLSNSVKPWTQSSNTTGPESTINQILLPPPIPATDTTQASINDKLSCTTSNGETGECIAYYLCYEDTENSTVFFDISVKPCLSYMDTCCPLANQIPPTVLVKPTPGLQATIAMGETSWQNKTGPELTINQDLLPPHAPSTYTTQAPIDDRLSCTTARGEIGECISYDLCNVTNESTEKNTGFIPIDVIPCRSYMVTCCPFANHTPPPVPVKPTPVFPQPTGATRVGCGWRNPSGIGFALSFADDLGETMFGEFPWMVAVLKTEPLDEKDPDGPKKSVTYIGGGSLIHPSVVLTTLNKVVPVKKLRVRAGEWDTQTIKEIYPFQERDVKTVAVQKDFYRGSSFEMLLFLIEEMDLAPNVGLACLSGARDLKVTGTRCYAMGWGTDLFGKVGHYQVILNKIQLPIVDHDICQAHLRQYFRKQGSEVPKSLICAGGETGKDTCVADGGSPLLCPVESQKDRYVQSGIAASTYGCIKDSTPGVYVDVADLRPWIDDQVTKRGYDTSTYSLKAQD